MFNIKKLALIFIASCLALNTLVFAENAQQNGNLFRRKKPVRLRAGRSEARLSREISAHRRFCEYACGTRNDRETRAHRDRRH